MLKLKSLLLLLFVEGKRAEETSGMVIPDNEDASMRFAERLFSLMDENKDGELTIEEFVKGFHKLKVQGNCYGDVTVTAYITERKLTKDDLLPKPAIPLRRKSLRRGSSSVKLFNNNNEANHKDGPEAKVNDAKHRNDPELAKFADGKGNDDPASVINASAIASATKAATIISAKAKMHNEDDPADDEEMRFAAVAAASKFKAKVKLRKKEAVRKIRRVWKIKSFW